MAFIIPRKIIASQYAAMDWQTIVLERDLSSTAATAILHYEISVNQATDTIVRVRAGGDASNGLILIDTSSSQATDHVTMSGQIFCPVSTGEKTIEVKIEGTGLSSKGFNLSVTGEIRKHPDGVSPSTGFSNEITSNEFINDWNQVMDYRTPVTGVISGIYSTYSEAAGDRKFKVWYRTLTLPSQYDLGLEVETVFENNAGDTLDFRLPENAVLVGLYSEFNGTFQDRRYKVRYRQVNLPAERMIWGVERISDYVHQLQEDMNYHAPSGEVITGFFSEFNDITNDRRWKFRTRPLDIY